MMNVRSRRWEAQDCALLMVVGSGAVMKAAVKRHRDERVSVSVTVVGNAVLLKAATSLRPGVRMCAWRMVEGKSVTTPCARGLQREGVQGRVLITRAAVGRAATKWQ